MESHRSTALITGASRGLGLALARDLARRGWTLVIDARDGAALDRAAAELAATGSGPVSEVRALCGDVADEGHRLALADAARALGGLDAVVHNASHLGPSPQPALADYPLDELERVYQVDVLAPVRLTQLVLPFIRPGGRLLFVTSDAASEPYPGWGGYGSAKAALEQAAAVWAAELPQLRVYRVDPGDMRTQMHQEAFPGEDISDRPEPDVSVPGIVELLTGELPSGRYRAREVGRVTA